MIKINFIGLKDSGKSLTCALLAKLISKKNKTLIFNIDLFTKYTEFFKRNLVTKKIEIDNKTIKLIPINANLDLIDLNINEAIQENINYIIDKLSSSYSIILIDHLVSLTSINLECLNKSDFIICPFKIEKDILKFKEKVLNTFIKNSISFTNFKFLPVLSKSNETNMNQMLILRKQLSSLLFNNTICYHEFKKYSDLIKNTKLLNEYNLVLDEIKKEIKEIK